MEVRVPQNIVRPKTCKSVFYLQDVKNTLQVYDLDSGKFLYNLSLDIGSVVGMSGKKTHSEIFYKFSSMITPGIIYYADVSKQPVSPRVSVHL
jgi:prolyl oligopeptidase PreP (S9A serine peptidase family)